MENFKADFHAHQDSDEMFIVVAGSMHIDLESSSVQLDRGDSYTVKAGLLHRARVLEQVEIITILKNK